MIDCPIFTILSPKLIVLREAPQGTIPSMEANRLSEKRQFMNRFVQFINTADARLAEELVASQAVFHVPGRPEPVRGPEGYLEIIGMMRGGFPDIQWTLEETVVEDDAIAARFTMRGTHRGAFFGMPPTRKTIAVQALNIYRLSNGKIVSEVGQPDLLGLLQQIGAIQTPS
jgi:steroid delta-isomerase-like uncharacterized protein